MSDTGKPPRRDGLAMTGMAAITAALIRVPAILRGPTGVVVMAICIGVAAFLLRRVRQCEGRSLAVTAALVALALNLGFGLAQDVSMLKLVAVCSAVTAVVLGAAAIGGALASRSMVPK